MRQAHLTVLPLSLCLALSCSGGFKGGDTGDSASASADGSDGSDGGGDGGTDSDGGDGGDGEGDPIDETYIGGWPKDACADDIRASGSEEGDVAEDFLLEDQFGEEVRLYDFCDHYVLIQFGAMWDGATQANSQELQDWSEWYGGADRLVVVEAMGENVDAEAPSTADLSDWADELDLTFPVLADPGFEVFDRYGERSIPFYLLIRPGVEIATSTYELSQEDVINLIDG